MRSDSDQPSLLRQIASGTLWVLICSSLARVVMFIANIVIARTLTTAEFGQFMTVRNTVGMVEAVSTASLGDVLLMETSKSYGRDKVRFQRALVVALLLNSALAGLFALILVCFSELIIDRLFLGETEIRSALYIAALLLLFSLLSVSVQRVCIGIQALREYAVYSIGVGMISLPLMWLLVKWGDVTGAIIGVTVHFAIDALAKVRIFSKELGFDRNPTWLADLKVTISAFVRSCSWLVGAAFATAAFLWYLRIATINATGSFEEIAAFDVAYQWASMILIITGGLGSMSLQIMSRRSVHGDSERVDDVLWISIATTILIALTISILMAILAEQALALYGSQYAGNELLIYGAGLIALFNAVSTVVSKSLIVQGQERWVLVSITGACLGAYIFFLSDVVEAGAFGLECTITVFYIISTGFLMAGYVHHKKRRVSES